mgnify:CR=1 FL=1
MEQVLKDTTANPAPLGLFGFGMTTMLLNIHNAGFFELNSMIMGMGIFFGGTQQVIAGIMEWKKGNGFAMAAFTSYGLFWFYICLYILLIFFHFLNQFYLFFYFILFFYNYKKKPALILCPFQTLYSLKKILHHPKQLQLEQQ